MLLNNMQSYRVMVKGVSCYCVSGSQLLSNPVTYQYRKIQLEISLFATHSFNPQILSDLTNTAEL